jgi:molybdate transport system substrate-binding protein
MPLRNQIPGFDSRRSAPVSLTTTLLCGALALAGCRQEGDLRDKTVSVFAASSLTEAFRDIEAAFEQRYPDVDVRTTFAGSQVLRLQIEQGAGADVFASANQEHMDALVDEALVEDAEVFALNEMVVIIPRDDSPGFASFDDLTRAQRVVIGAPSVPAGVYARTVLDRVSEIRGSAFSDSVLAHVVSEEVNVRLVRAKVELGEVDAALVYRTDAVAATRVAVVPIPPEFNVEARYSIGRIVGAQGSELAVSFLAFVCSSPGQALLTRHGFKMPPP